MKLKPCDNPSCSQRRIHFSLPDVNRSTQMVEVADDFDMDKPAFCSLTCAMLAGALTAKKKEETEQ